MTAQKIGQAFGVALATLIALAVLPVLIVIAAVGSVVITVVAVVKAVIKTGKSMPPVAPKPPLVKNDTAPVPLASDPEVRRNTRIETPYGDIDWAKVAICDPTKKVGSS